MEPIEDQRGYFARNYCAREMQERGLQADFVQINISRNHLKGTLRGLHFQQVPYLEVKLVQCIRGRVFDVIVDLRANSATRGESYAVELTAQAHNLLYIPAGFAHGFQTLDDDTELLYLMGEYYVAGAEAGIHWNDSALSINWPLSENPVVSDRDEELPLLSEIAWLEDIGSHPVNS